MNDSSKGLSMWMIAGVVVVFAWILQALSSGSSSYSPAPVSRGTFEHRYATERFKQEGFSSSDAATAADAVVRFHEAQQRNRR